MGAYFATSSSTHIAIPAAVIVALITAAATLVVGVFNLRTQRSGLQWQRDHAAKQIDLMQAGQITDRFMRAVEHLGSESSEVRIGAIFALERIARESPKDRPHIVSTLAVLVRNRLPESEVKEGEYVAVLLRRVPDAQAALTALCRSPLSDDRRDWSEIGGLDLTRTDLRRASLRNANLHSANLWRSHLEGADLYGADLQDCILGAANFNSFEPTNQPFNVVPTFDRPTSVVHSFKVPGT